VAALGWDIICHRGCRMHFHLSFYEHLGMQIEPYVIVKFNLIMSKLYCE